MIDRETRVQGFKSDLESDLSSVEADISSHKSALARLEQERDGLQQLIAEANKFLSNIRRDNGHLESGIDLFPQTESEADLASSGESIRQTNGVPKNLNRRQVIMQIIPAFQGSRFNSGDVRQRFVEDYLDGIEPPNFPQAINNLLKRMADKGEIEDLGRDESESRAPRYYREIKNQEVNLLEP